MSVINGSDLYMWMAGELIAYSTSYTLSVTMDTRPGTNKGSGLWKRRLPGMFDSSVSCDGLYVFDNSAARVINAMLARNTVTLHLGSKAPGLETLDPTKEYTTGSYYITSFEQSASDAENATWSASFEFAEAFAFRPAEDDVPDPWDTAVDGVYYVKNGGNDDADGMTDATAWETLTKVNAFAFAPGNKVSFKRGDTFRGSIYRNGLNGTFGAPITFSAYGTGAKPKIFGSKDLSATGDWENDAGNVWKTTATLGTLQDDISNLVFNNEATCGVKVIEIGDVDTQGYFFYNTADNLVYMYSVGNPATFYTHIEACGHHDINQALVMINDCDYITVEYLDVRYSSAAGIEFKNSNYGIIQYNEVSWIGGEYLNPAVDATRLGNGISVTLTSSNIIIRYNKATQCFDAGISPQGWGTFTLTNISMYYNIVNYCHYSYEVWATATGTHVNVDFYNNVCVNAGYGWGTSMLQRPDADLGNNSHVMIWTQAGTVTNCNIKNNIFATARERGLIIGFTSSPMKWLMDYNIFYNFTTFAQNEDSAVIYDDLAEWRTGSGRDANSISDNPDFISSTNFHVQAGSPAINAGTYLALATDYDGVTVGNPPEIGAYEYV